MIRQLVGDCRETLPTVDAGVAQACITSPPYYGLRDYGTPPLVWGGESAEWGAGGIHLHEFGVAIAGDNRGGSGTPTNKNGRGENYGRDAARGQFCDCGAWLGTLGLEPTPELYIDHIVECFRHVRRVLRDDGVLWLNLGDSYAGSGNGSNDHRQNGKAFRKGVDSLSLNADKYKGQKPGAIANLPAKNLLMMPFRVGMALQADGWWMRSVIPWLKRNSMPESVTDRPSTSVEYVFLLAKSARYFWNADAVRMPLLASSNERRRYAIDDIRSSVANEYRDQHQKSASKNGVPTREYPPPHENGRNRRNSDWFFESWQGLMLDEADDPLALVVNPQPFSGAHFATFPAKLVEPMVKASTRPGDTVLDPFGGAGTVGLVADRLGRNAILCELKAEYASMGTNRIVDDAPMFTEVAAD